MTRRAFGIGIVILLSSMTWGGAAFAQDSEDGSTIMVDGRTIHYKVVGTYSNRKQSVRNTNGKVALDLDLDGANHKILVTETKVSYNGKSKTFDAITKVNIRIEKKEAVIEVDGKQIFPEP